MIIPSLMSSVTDRRLAWHDRAAFLWLALHGVLDLNEYRPLKALQVQVGIGCRKRTAYEILRKLTEAGYVQCGEDDPAAPLEARGSKPRWYRLRYAVVVPREFPSRTTRRTAA